MARKKTLYDLLEVTRAAPDAVIRAVYRAWMGAMRSHPDLGGDEEFARALNEAYETLRDPKRRAAYDATLPGEEDDQGARRAPRRPVNVEIAFCHSSSGDWLKARALDASILGLRLMADAPLQEGDHIAIAFPGSANKAVEASVRWSKMIGTKGFWTCEAGVEFFNPIPHIFRILGRK
jgi:hypothetical protein